MVEPQRVSDAGKGSHAFSPEPIDRERLASGIQQRLGTMDHFNPNRFGCHGGHVRAQLTSSGFIDSVGARECDQVGPLQAVKWLNGIIAAGCAYRAVHPSPRPTSSW